MGAAALSRLPAAPGAGDIELVLRIQPNRGNAIDRTAGVVHARRHRHRHIGLARRSWAVPVPTGRMTPRNGSKDPIPTV
jgi:hypothetical protein